MATPPIDPLPDPPQRGNPPEDFIQKADAFLGALPNFQSQLNATAQAVDQNAYNVETARTEVAAKTTQAQTAATQAQNAANNALSAPGTGATSITNMTIGIGSKTFVIQAGKALFVGQRVVAAITASPTNQMSGIITDHISATGTMTVLFDSVSGSGTGSAWTISLTASTVITPATAADVWAGTDNSKPITSATLAAAQVFQALTDAATIAFDVAANGINAQVTLGASRVQGLPSNVRSGWEYAIKYKQPAAGGPFTVTFPGNFDFGPAGNPTLSTGANKEDVVYFHVLDPVAPKFKAQFVKAA